MPIFFKDRIPDPIHGENARYYDAIANNGTMNLSDFKLVLKNNIPPDKLGDPANAANLNYASGNIVLPAAAETHKGDLLSLTQHGVIPAKTIRPVAAHGPAASAVMLQFGYLRLSDTKLLLMYFDRMVVATINWTNKTVTFGTYMMHSNMGFAGATVQGQSIVLRSYNENSTALVFTVVRNPSPLAYYPLLISITGDTIAYPSWNTNIFPAAHTMVTNPAKVGNGMILMCSSLGTGSAQASYATLLDGSTGALTQVTQVQIPGVTGAAMYHTLFCYDKANNKYLLVYTVSTNVYAIGITVAGNSLSFGSPQLLGTTTNTLFPGGAQHMPGGMNVSEGDGRIVLFADTSGSGVVGPLRFQALSVNSSGVVSKGTIQDLPICNITGASYSGSSCLTYGRTAGKVYITGIDYEISPRDACVAEITLSGVNAPVKKYRPFQPLESANDGSAMSAMKNAVCENPNNPDEFLFMQGFNSAPLTDLIFWYGRRTDVIRPNNIIGAAIDEPSGGNVRVQTTAKYLPGLFNGLTAGQFYSAGDNGALVQFTGASGTDPLGLAVTQTDFLFFGAARI